MLYELIPCIDKIKAKRLSRQLASLPALRSLDASTSSECLKIRLKKLSQQLLDVAAKKRRRSEKVTIKSEIKETTPSKPPITKAKEVSSKVEQMTTLNVGLAKVDRHHILMNKVGEDMYNDILSVSQEILNIRHHSAVWTKFTKQQDHLIIAGEERAPASELLPSPIADIYFRTRLIDVMRVVDAKTCLPLTEVPEPCACIVQRMDWDALLQDAKAKLAAFRKFEREHFEEGEDLSFKCTTGMCFVPCRK